MGERTVIQQCLQMFEGIARDVASCSHLDDDWNVGAEATCKQPLQVAIKPLEWRGSSSDSPVGEYVARKDFDAGDDAPWDLELDGLPIGKTYPSLREAKAVAQSDFETRVRSALVSGSREDNP